MNVLIRPSFEGNTQQTYLDYEIKCMLKNKLEPLQLGDFAYFIIGRDQSGCSKIITTLPDCWAERYINGSFHLIDPVMLSAQTRIYPFSWKCKEFIELKKESNIVLAVAEEYNIIEGYTFTAHFGRECLGVLSIYNSAKRSDFFSEMSKNIATIYMFFIAIHEDVVLKSINDEFKEHKFELTSREKEIFFWAAEGKTYWEISVILGISVSTVKYHFGNIVTKMNVSNAKHAIRKGVEYGLISQFREQLAR